jgi:hypothetical protein
MPAFSMSQSRGQRHLEHLPKEVQFWLHPWLLLAPVTSSRLI